MLVLCAELLDGVGGPPVQPCRPELRLRLLHLRDGDRRFYLLEVLLVLLVGCLDTLCSRVKQLRLSPRLPADLLVLRYSGLCKQSSAILALNPRLVVDRGLILYLNLFLHRD